MNTLFNFNDFVNENLNEKDQITENVGLEKLTISNHIETFLTELNEMNENEVDEMLNENQQTLKNFGYELMEQKKNIDKLNNNIEATNRLAMKSSEDLVKLANVLNNVIQKNNLKK